LLRSLGIETVWWQDERWHEVRPSEPEQDGHS
jgi:hypothetical protein